MTNARVFPYGKDDRASVGIGTMIVFIATILVAAVAASVLIDTSSKLQERSSRTGNEATDQVSSNIKVDMLIGKRDNTGQAGLQDLEIFLSLAPGSQNVDLSQMRIQLKNGTTLKTFNWTAGSASATTFTSAAVRDADGSHTSSNPVMTAGDLVKIGIDLNAAGAPYEPRNRVIMLFLPEIGNKVTIGFNTPPSYGADTIVQLS